MKAATSLSLFSLSLFGVLIFCTSCTHWLYAPSRDLHYDVKTLPIPPLEHFIEVESGQRIQLWHFKTPHPYPKGLLLHFHGNGENQSTHFMFFYWAVAHGYDLVTFDYRGYGRSDNPPQLSPKTTVEDGLKAFSFIQSLRKKDGQQLPVIAIGQSLGGAVLLKTVILLPAAHQPDFLVLDSTFMSYRQAARSVLSQSWLLTLFKPLTSVVIDDSWSVSANVSQLEQLNSIPKVVVHGTKDRIIDYRLGEKLFNQLPEPKFLWTVKDGDHTSAFLPAQRAIYSQKLTDCLSVYFKERLTEKCH